MTIMFTDVDGTAQERALYEGFVEIMYKEGRITDKDVQKITEALKISNWEERVKAVAGIIFKEPLPLTTYRQFCDKVTKNIKPKNLFKSLVEDVKPDKIYAFSGSEKNGVEKWFEQYFPGYEIEVCGTVLKQEGNSITGTVEYAWDGEKRRRFVENLRDNKIGIGNEPNDISMLEVCDIGIYVGNPDDINGNPKIYKGIADFYNNLLVGNMANPVLEMPDISPRRF